MYLEHRWMAGVTALMVVVALACGGELAVEPPTPWDDAAEQAEAGANKPIGAIVHGSAFNALLPDDGHEGHSRVFTQEKEGYAEAEYSLDGQTVLTMSISDTRDNPSARDKYGAATEAIGSFPVMSRGKNSSMVLVQDRFQVRVSSDVLDHRGRTAWLSAAELDSLADLH
ncbi:MAG: hypothetical protein KTR31_29165 [Myxococcales bacterium]|nr:hypothetical protein [Myxococcales bacterium]